MDTVAILIDGGFYTRRAKVLWGDQPAKDSADTLHQYCMKHLVHTERNTAERSISASKLKIACRVGRRMVSTQIFNASRTDR